MDTNNIQSFERDDECFGKRTCTIQVDDPALDATDLAHPAWFRGSDHATKEMAKQILRDLKQKKVEKVIIRLEKILSLHP